MPSDPVDGAIDLRERASAAGTAPSLQLGADDVRAHGSNRLCARRAVARHGAIAWRCGLPVSIQWILELTGLWIQGSLRQPSHQWG